MMLNVTHTKQQLCAAPHARMAGCPYLPIQLLPAQSCSLAVPLCAFMSSCCFSSCYVCALLQFLLGRDIGQRLRRLQRCLRRLAAAASALLQHCSSPGSSGQHCTQQVGYLDAISQMQQQT
jgi:hypothetical protein